MNTREARGHQRQARTNSYLNELDVPVALAGQEAHVGVVVVEGNQDSGKKIRGMLGNSAFFYSLQLLNFNEEQGA